MGVVWGGCGGVFVSFKDVQANFQATQSEHFQVWVCYRVLWRDCGGVWATGDVSTMSTYSARVVSCPWSYLWFSWTGSWGAAVVWRVSCFFFFFSCSKPRNLSVSGSEGEEGAQTSRRSMAWSRSSSGRKEPAEVVQASDQTLKCSNNNSHKKKYAYTTYTVHTQFNNNRSQFLHFSQHWNCISVHALELALISVRSATSTDTFSFI